MIRWTNGLGIMGLAGALMLGGCRGRDKAVAEDLSDAGYRLTADDWFRAAASDDVAVLGRFQQGGYAVDRRDAQGDTALHAAAAAGAEKAAKWLLDRKLPVDVRGANQRTPLMAAVVAGKPSMTRWLLRQGADVHAKDGEDFRPMMLAVKEGRGEVVGELAAYDREELDDALLLAALLGKTTVIDALTRYGASVYARMDDGRTPLMLAAEHGHRDAAKLLVDLGANRFTVHPDGRTAADIAAASGHEELAAMLRADPAPEEFSLQTEQQLGEQMVAKVESFEGGDPMDNAGEAKGAASESHGSAGKGGGSVRPRSSAPVVSLAGQTLGARDSNRTPANASSTAAEKPELLVMRQFRQRELPLEVRHVEGPVARLVLKTQRARELKVQEGDTIPGTPLKVLQVHRRMESGKENFGRPVEVSVVELEDSATGARRSVVVGVPASAHDPVALVEDPATGRRYVAAPGQPFTSADGTRYTISDVRPNQLVIEEAGTGRVQTLPLRGPRG